MSERNCETCKYEARCRNIHALSKCWGDKDKDHWQPNAPHCCSPSKRRLRRGRSKRNENRYI
jgi:hypothetical protein